MIVAEVIFTLWFTCIVETSAFIPRINLRNSYQLLSSDPPTTVRSTETSIFVRSKKVNEGNANGKKSYKNDGAITLGEFVQRISKDEAKLAGRSTSKKRKRTRSRTDAPKQKYIYASQRKASEKTGKTIQNTESDIENDGKKEELPKPPATIDENNQEN